MALGWKWQGQSAGSTQSPSWESRPGGHPQPDWQPSAVPGRHVLPKDRSWQE